MLHWYTEKHNRRKVERLWRENKAGDPSSAIQRNLQPIDDIDNHKSPISEAIVISADIKFEKLEPATRPGT